jgi:electron transfer flavoprotein alpha/beta subunit
LNVIVLVKPVPDLTQLSVSASQGRVFEKGKRLMNPADAAAIQAAVDGGGPVTALSVAHTDDTDGLRRGLAMGAADAVLAVHTEAREFDASMVTGAILAIRGDAECIFAGPGQIGPRLAEALGWALSTDPKPAPRTVHVIGDYPARLPAAIALIKAARKPIRTVEARPGPRTVVVRSMELHE